MMALNVYAQVPANAGQLKVWNIEPDDETRAELGLTNVGFPYPAEPLDDFKHHHSGGNRRYCRSEWQPCSRRLARQPRLITNRLLLTCFMTVNLANELIWWT